jgi:hypothetical protein
VESESNAYDDYQEEEYEELEENDEEYTQTPIETHKSSSNRYAEHEKERLKGIILQWINNDDRIKEMNAQLKELKDAKKVQEETILKMLVNLGMDKDAVDVKDDDGQFRGRVYRQKSTTKGALKEDTIKAALMELFQNEKKVDQMVKKIESKRPINERYYLKRTKGNTQD